MWSRFLYQLSQGTEVSLITLGLHIAIHREEQQWVILQRPYQARIFPGDVLNPSPREAADFPKRRVLQCIGPFVLLRRNSPTIVTLLFFLVEVVVIREAVHADICSISGVDGPSSMLFID